MRLSPSAQLPSPRDQLKCLVAPMSEPLRFQHYEVARKPDGSPVELGRGAMGITYRAFDTNLRADVALKVISGAYLNSDTARERFLREARAAAAIRHPNVATVFHLGDAEESYFYAMEFVDGETVERLMRREGALPTLRALDIASQVARALGAAQKQNLVHRDIKPSNIMLTRDEDDDEDLVKVIDFGLAKAGATNSADGDAPTLTMGGFLGTPHFASPEQLDERELDVRSDIYSLGVTLFYMLAGEVPFGGSLAQTISRQLQHEPPWEKIAAQPTSVRDLVGRMMAKDPADRFANPLELRRAIDATIAAVDRDDLEVPGGSRVEPLPDATTSVPPPASTVTPSIRAGSQLAGRYELLEEIPASPLGRRFRARNTESGKAVGLILLEPHLLPNPSARNRFEDEIAALQAVRLPVILRIDGIEDDPPQTWITHEWVNGPTLLDEIRGRGPFAPSRAADICEHVAAGLAALAQAGVTCPVLAPTSVRLPPTDPGVKIDPLSPDSISAISSMATLADSSIRRLRARGVFTEHPETEFTYALASIAYEMLSGVRPGGADQPFTPVPSLSEPVNRVLREGLDPRNELRAVTPYAAALTDALRAHKTAPSTPRPANGKRAKFEPWNRRTLLIAGCATVVLLCLLLLLFPQPSEEDTTSLPTPDPTPSTTPTPTPPPVDHVAAAIEESGDHAAVGDFQAAFATLTTLDPTDARDPRVSQAYESLSARLRSESTDLTPFEAPLQSAADSDSLSATYLLANLYDQRGLAQQAFPLYLEAAKAGDAEAMTKTGAAYAAGWGTDQSWPQSIDWFTRAAAAGDPSADYALGECYALGKGVPKDTAKAFVHLDLAARAYDHILAKTLLADLYLNGDFGSANNAEAFRLFTEAANQGSLVAKAKLGVMIYSGKVVDGAPIEGKPTPSKEGYREAFQIFAEGAAQDHPLSLYYHALLLNSGTGTPEKDPVTARSQFIRAARAGEKNAIAWCRQNNVAYEINELTPAPAPTDQSLPETPAADATEAQ